MNLVHFSQFPNSKVDPFLVTSPHSPAYNCIAWAFGDNTKWYWPDPSTIYYWPNNVPREINIEAFIKLFEYIGYKVCENGEFEIGYRKIAIFVDPMGVPTHAARQIDNGLWTSKLGSNIDVQHSIKSMEDGEYGMVSIYMKRSNSKI
ncbi:MAG: hypothetical protein JEY97_13185 [Bacteroidales bacterium]|nr:hypothetical protein [Bacteroidales bacterium]